MTCEGYLRANPDAATILEYIRENGPVTAKQMGRDLPDITPNRRSQISRMLKEYGLITGRRTTESSRITIEWRAI